MEYDMYLEYKYLEEIQDMIDLPLLGVDSETIIFAGFGSGATMAHQMHIVYSSTIKGVGLVEGAPYYSKPSLNREGSNV